MQGQGLYVVWLLAAGAAMGTVFDLYNTTLGSAGWLRWLRPAVDLSFWAASALGVYRIAYVADDGRVRLYLFVLIALGWLLYALTLRGIVVGSARTLVRVAAAVLRAAATVAAVLVLRPALALARAGGRLAVGLYRLLCAVEDVACRLIRLILRLLGLYRLARGPRVRAAGKRISVGWEELWARASNWVQHAWTRRTGHSG